TLACEDKTASGDTAVSGGRYPTGVRRGEEVRTGASTRPRLALESRRVPLGVSPGVGPQEQTELGSVVGGTGDSPLGWVPRNRLNCGQWLE
ncbi:hypothetical protein JZ751_018097, partial [Albula glossodonta]